MRTTRIPNGARVEWTTAERASRPSRWADAGGLVAPLVALALWVLVVTQVAAPLGAALARIDAGRATAAPAVADPAPCPLPRGALASASRGPEAGRCR